MQGSLSEAGSIPARPMAGYDKREQSIPSSVPTTMPLLRRAFLLHGAGLAAFSTLATRRLLAEDSPQSTSEIITKLVAINDTKIPAWLTTQEQRADHRWLGASIGGNGIHWVQGTTEMISGLCCGICGPGSTYFQSEQLVGPLRLAVAYLLRAQHPDGTIDLHTSNFASPPDTAFAIDRMYPVYRLFSASRLPALQEIAVDLGTFIQRAAAAVAVGGMHTPNHRWVACAALAQANAIEPHQAYVDRANAWLAETIDIDPDGQDTEKSTLAYSAVIDRALITTADLLQRPELYDPVRRNLEMMLYYTHADGEVVTEASRRQDRFSRGSLARYYLPYRTLALRDGNGQFAAVARQLERNHLNQMIDLIAFLSEPAFGGELPPSSPLPDRYAKVFPHSSLARIRRGRTSATILADNTTFFSLHKGAAALDAVRLATAFFGKGQFSSDTLTVEDGRFILRHVLEGPYYQPLTPQQIAAGDHIKMAPQGTVTGDRAKFRAVSNVQRMEMTVEITERDGSFGVEFSVVGTPDVPVTIELACRHGGTLAGVEPLGGSGTAFLLPSGTGRYTVGADTIEFGPGIRDHTYTQIRGALTKWDGQSVFLTGMTPFHHTLSIG